MVLFFFHVARIEVPRSPFVFSTGSGTGYGTRREASAHFQALSNPAEYGGLSSAEETALRLSLTNAINLTVSLAGTLDTPTTTALVQALEAVVGSSANIDATLFDLLLELVQSLASLAGQAAGSFLNIVSAMIQARGVGNNDNANAISSSLANLALSVLEDAVCGQPVSNVSSAGLQLLAAFQSSYAGDSVTLTGGSGLQFGTDFGNFAGGDVVDDSVCKKSQVVSQSTAPYVTTENGTFTYVVAGDDRTRQEPRAAQGVSADAAVVMEPLRAGGVFRHRLPENTTYITVSFFDSNGDDYPVSGLGSTQLSYLSFPVPNCTAANACMHLVSAHTPVTTGAG